ncbi:hypothetical protein DEI84_02495 [Curtobacterium sp. MCBD17_023]|nr:hypothetical protein DEI84_02495 [Curtobacterium sp. MCBD17_023]
MSYLTTPSTQARLGPERCHARFARRHFGRRSTSFDGSKSATRQSENVYCLHVRHRDIRALVDIADGVVFVEGPASNWVILAGRDGVSLIDAGYPADSALVVDSIRISGYDPSELKRVFITHGHVDHVGGVPEILKRYPDVDVLVAASEIANVHGPDREQVTFTDVGGRVASLRVIRWLSFAVASGGLARVRVPSARAFTAADFQNRGLQPVCAPGHTEGSTAYELLGTEALVTGDAIITHHATQPSRWEARPRMIPAYFTSDPDRAFVSAQALPRARLILPGHGPAVGRVGNQWVPLTRKRLT